jgi:hypothetical protein
MNKFKNVGFTICLMLLTKFSIFAQNTENTSNENVAKYVYCEMVGTQKLFSTKVTIALDFGEERSIWKDNRLKDEVTGRAQSFNSMVDALNYMGEQGWEFAQAYVVTVGQQNVYHWLLKKNKDE